MQHVGGLHSHRASLYAQWWEQHIGPIVLNDLPYLVQSLEYDAINLLWRHEYLFHTVVSSSHKLVQLGFRSVEVLILLACDEDFVGSTPVRARWSVAKELRERWWEVDSSVSRGLDMLDVSSEPAADHRVHRQLDFEDVDLSFQLQCSQHNLH